MLLLVLLKNYKLIFRYEITHLSLMTYKHFMKKSNYRKQVERLEEITIARMLIDSRIDKKCV